MIGLGVPYVAQHVIRYGILYKGARVNEKICEKLQKRSILEDESRKSDLQCIECDGERSTEGDPKRGTLLTALPWKDPSRLKAE